MRLKNAFNNIFLRIRIGLVLLIGIGVPHLYLSYLIPIEAENERQSFEINAVEPILGDFLSYINLSFDPQGRIAHAQAQEHVSIEPSITDLIAVGGNGRLLIYGNFKPGATYTVCVKRGLTSENDLILKEDYTTTVTMPDVEPEIRFPEKGFLIPRKGPLTLDIATINIKRLNLGITKVFLDQLPRLVQTDVIDIESAPPNAEIVTKLPLKDYLTGVRGGIFKVLTRHTEGWRKAEHLILITDLGIVAKRAGNELWVWVNSLDDLAPVPQATVKLIGKRRWGIPDGLPGAIRTAKTNADGFVKVPLVADEVNKYRGLILTVAKGDDFSFLRVDSQRILTGDFRIDSRPNLDPEIAERLEFFTDMPVTPPVNSEAGYRAFLYTNGGAYRPGEKVHLVGIVRRQQTGADDEVPTALPTRIEVITPENKTLAAFQEQTDHDGACEIEIKLPAWAQTGVYTAKMSANEKSIGSVSFQVEEFMPDRIKVTVDTDKAAYRFDEEIRLKVSVAHLFGAPASGLKVEAMYWIEEGMHDLQGEKWRSFNFSQTSDAFHTEGFDIGETLTTDAEGKVEYQFKVPQSEQSTSRLTGTIRVTAQETGGRVVTTDKTISIHSYSHYVGLQREEMTETVKPNQEVGFNYIVVDQEGAAAAGRTVEATLYAISGTETTPLETRTLTSAPEKERFTFIPSRHGEHRVEITDVVSGSQASVGFYVSEWGGVPASEDNFLELDLTLDKAAYQPGETAALHIKAPFPGKLLLTIEREKVLHYQTFTMNEPTATVEIPVEGAYCPNVYLYATLLRATAALEKAAPARAFGILPLKLDAESNRLTIVLDMPKQVRPNREMEIKFHVRGPQRNTGKAYRVSIAAVDDGIVQLTDFQTPAPYAYFHRQRQLETYAYEFYTALTSIRHFPIHPLKELQDFLAPPEQVRLSYASASFAPNLGRRNGNYRGTYSNFGPESSVYYFMAPVEGSRVDTNSGIRVKPVSLWSGLGTTDTEGRGAVRFRIPQFNGSLRVMAVAFSGDTYGSVTQQIEVSEPLMLIPTFPRFLTGGDRIRVPVTVFNGTVAPDDFTVELKATGPVQLLTASDFGEPLPVARNASLRKQIHVPTGTTKYLFFDVLAYETVGTVAFHLSASGNGETTERLVHLPLRSAAPPVTQSGHGVVRAGESADFVFPSNLLPESSEFLLTVAPFPAVKFGGGLRYLIQYPHGCLEQTTSQVFTLLYLNEIAKLVEPTLVDADGQNSKVNAYIKAGITKLEGMLLPSHHFAYWPNGDDTNPWASIYAAHFLVEVRKAGYEVDDSVYDRMLEGLRERAKQMGSRIASEAEDKYKIAQSVYACYVLAAAGQPEKMVMHSFSDDWFNDLKDHSRFRLAAAFARIGERQRALSLLPTTIDLNASNQRETGHNFDSPIRNHAIMLDVLLEIDANHPAIPSLVESLTEAASADGRWATTQENAFAFLALGKMLKRYTSDKYTGRLTFNGAPFADFDAAGRQWTATDWDGARVQLTLEGDGSASYYWAAFGVSRDSHIEEYERDLQLSRRYLNQDGMATGSVFRSGELVVAEITVKALARTLENVVVVDMLPAGFEIENPRLHARVDLPWMKEQFLTPDNMDIRDDRLVFFGRFPRQQERKFYYLLRAVTPGIFTVPPVSAETMYAPENSAVTSSGMVEIIE